CESGRDDNRRDSVFYARRRQLPFNTEHRLADLVIEAGLAAAEKATVATPTGAEMTTHVEPGPIINWYHWRGRVDGSWCRTCGVGGNGRRHQRRRNNAELDESVHVHDIAPHTKCSTGEKKQQFVAFQGGVCTLPSRVHRFGGDVAQAPLLCR